jgi:hypothetical protein
MIKEEKINVHISYRNITHYKKLGYDVKLHEMILINPTDLSPVSHQKITAVCDVCGNEKIIVYHKYLENEKRCGYYGCKPCSNEKRKITSIERFGVDNYMKTEECKKMVADNNMKKYGVKTTLLEKNTKDKIDKTIFDIYGVDNILSSKTIIEKSRKTMFEKYGEKYYRTSGKELEILSFLNENCKYKILQNNTTVINKELDMYIAELNLAVEFNGIYWHSDRYKTKDFHWKKTELCEQNNVNLIQIWEDDWIYRQEIVKSMLLNKLNKTENKIFARKCQIKEINNNDLIKKFLIKNHIQGFVGSQIKLGLFYNNELVSLMTFGKQRKSMGSNYVEDSFELLRFCNKLNTNVVGGASKLFTYFIKKYEPNEIISYANRCWSMGNMYKKLGFELIKKTSPNYHYFDRKCHRYNRFNFRKDVLIKMGYDKSKTEFQIMNELPYYRVYDSGSLKFLFKPNLNKNL